MYYAPDDDNKLNIETKVIKKKITVAELLALFSFVYITILGWVLFITVYLLLLFFFLNDFQLFFIHI